MDKDGDYVKAVVRERRGSREHAVHPYGNTRSAKKGVPNGRTSVSRLKSVMIKLTGDQLKAYNEYVRKAVLRGAFQRRKRQHLCQKDRRPRRYPGSIAPIR